MGSSPGCILCIGTVRTSAVCTLQVETGDMPLCLCRKQLLVNCCMNARGHGHGHPTTEVVQTCWEKSRLGWTGDAAARHLKVHENMFSLTVTTGNNVGSFGTSSN